MRAPGRGMTKVEASVEVDAPPERGWEVTSVEADNRGFDLISRHPHPEDPQTAIEVRFIEVKGRITGADAICVTKNEILTSLNKPDDFILALVEFLDGDSHRVVYLRRPFERSGITTDFNGASVNFPFAM